MKEKIDANPSCKKTMIELAGFAASRSLPCPEAQTAYLAQEGSEWVREHADHPYLEAIYINTNCMGLLDASTLEMSRVFEQEASLPRSLCTLTTRHFLSLMMHAAMRYMQTPVNFNSLTDYDALPFLACATTDYDDTPMQLMAETAFNIVMLPSDRLPLRLIESDLFMWHSFRELRKEECNPLWRRHRLSVISRGALRAAREVRVALYQSDGFWPSMLASTSCVANAQVAQSICELLLVVTDGESIRENARKPEFMGVVSALMRPYVSTAIRRCMLATVQRLIDIGDEALFTTTNDEFWDDLASAGASGVKMLVYLAKITRPADCILGVRANMSRMRVCWRRGMISAKKCAQVMALSAF